MKLKTWLRDVKNMSYKEYRKIQKTARIWQLMDEFNEYNRVEMQNKIKQEWAEMWRLMTDEERDHLEDLLKKKRSAVECGEIKIFKG